MVTLDLVSWVIGSSIIWFLVRKFMIYAWWNPKEIEKHFRNHGVEGPSYKFLVGSFGEIAGIHRSRTKHDVPLEGNQIKHNIVPDFFPHIDLWREKYGRVFLYWFGPSPRLVVTEPELIKELLNHTNVYIKSISHPLIGDMMGGGLAFAEGEKWARHRKIVSPFFLTEELKGYAQTIVSCSNMMITRMQHSITSEGPELELHHQCRSFTKDVIARTGFQSNFKHLDRIVELQMEQMAMLKQVLTKFYVPGSRFFPTPYNIKRWRLHRELEEKFKELINSRDKSTKENDLLGLMLSATNNTYSDQGKNMSSEELMDECRTLFLAGFASTADLITWTFVLLATHTEWQDRARQEVEEVLQGNPPTYEILPALKIVNMILNEALRLYPPVPILLKKVENEVKLGNLIIPAGTHIEIPLIAVHQDPQQWGEDVYEFNPNRFIKGAAKASKHPMAFMPFTSGPRVCIGEKLGMTEAKICLSMILQKFSFVLSPSYKHSPDCLVTTTPLHGAYVIVHNI